ncbi:MAG: phosphomannomutase/phosphoglucomutase [Patescibacteria group bacterium]|nr:phosphomannomutase/phosphoglucomutase [Patescibacteria group bacterium]
MKKQRLKRKINPYIFRGYDIRGVVGKDLDFDLVKRIAKAYGYMLSQRRIREAVVGRDCRKSGEEYMKAVIEGLTESGINVIDLGMCLTQMMYFAQYHYKSNGGVMLTASHNPAEYNGMKLALGYSYTLVTEEIQQLKEFVEKQKQVKGAEPGKAIKAGGLRDNYFADLLKRVKIGKTFKVVVDASSGTAGEFAPDLLKRAGCEVVGLNCRVDGNFPAGTPDPTEEYILKRLGEKVVNEGADLGLAFDGDGDRMGVVDESGRYIWADVLTAIFADDILDFLPGGKIVYNVLCSKVVDEVIAKKGKSIMWKTGHSFIKDKAAQERAVFGGELSGHFFFLDNFYGHDDALFAALRLLEYLARKGQSFSKIIDSFGTYISSPEIKLGCADDEKVKLVDVKLKADLKAAFKTETKKVTTIDGVRLDFADGMLVVRYSQNGPYITVKFEAKEKKAYQERKQKLREILEKYSEIEWEGDKGANVEAIKK